MPEPSDSLSLPPEIWDAIIDQLQYDKRSLLRASLACRALYPRTRVHLFSRAVLSTESSCIRLAKLISLSPKLALLFKTLSIAITKGNDPDSRVYEALTVIESLVNLTQLTLTGGDWSQMPDTVVSSLQSYSYRSLVVNPFFSFRAIGEICSLLQNSPDLQWASFRCKSNFTEECHLNHSLHRIPAPVRLQIDDMASSVPFETFLKLATSSRACPFSFRNVHTLSIALSGQSRILRQLLNQYLVLLGTSLKFLHVNHTPGFLYTSSETLDVSSVEKIEVRIMKGDPNSFGRDSQVFEWWISNLSVVKECCAIRSIVFKIVATGPPYLERHPAFNWDNLWMRLDECLASYKMASLESLSITFHPPPEGKFPLLKQLDREVILNAT
ncbi:hypothetical protein ARMSODRAFT_679007 [Armillaria solidipes]|uniref:F-box domain-containing protein n=1 Tax=Armillaria solidipes TaxID=1076256 RepID=A0A2H3BAI6_9AGAR|nr:hypothetical protein ARMSODRAFT_679007 [Armillaria solidipes]